MKYKVTIYCPDQHISYNLHTLDEQGVGGGITARIRVAHALAAQGHSVTIYNNCPSNQIIDGVHYIHCKEFNEVETDIFIASTSGDGLDLSRLQEVEIQSKLSLLMVHGINPPKGVDLDRFDYIYALSNFVQDIIVNQWGIDPQKLFTTHRGVKGEYYQPLGNPNPERDPFGIVYTGHPSKGLEAAVKALNLLRQHDSRFSLHVYGGYQLWGERERAITETPSLIYHGLLGQRELAQEMQKYAFCLNLQSRAEPFGMVLIEAMRAGCIVLASPVGAFPEIVHHGYNGFLVNGKPADASTHLGVSHKILNLIENPNYINFIRRNAIVSPLDWSVVAETWSGHWDWALGKNQAPDNPFDLKPCPSCGTNWLPLADGLHCVSCGRYYGQHQGSLTP